MRQVKLLTKWAARLGPALALAPAAGCGTHALLVEPGTPVRLAEPAEARVYVPDGAGHWVRGDSPIRLPAGWYVLPPPARPAAPAPPASPPATRPVP